MEEKPTAKITFKELEKAAAPLINLLRKKGHSHMSAYVTVRNVVITEDIMGVPLNYED